MDGRFAWLSPLFTTAWTVGAITAAATVSRSVVFRVTGPSLGVNDAACVDYGPADNDVTKEHVVSGSGHALLSTPTSRPTRTPANGRWMLVAAVAAGVAPGTLIGQLAMTMLCRPTWPRKYVLTSAALRLLGKPCSESSIVRAVASSAASGHIYLTE